MTEHGLAMLTRALMGRKSHKQGLSRKGQGFGRSGPAGENCESVRRKTDQETWPPGRHG